MPIEDTNKWTFDAVIKHVEMIISGNDRRYEQMFVDQGKLIEQGFSSQKGAVESALNAADRAVAKAELAADKRFESVNEFRSTLADQQRTLIPRAEVDVIVKAFNDKIDMIKKQVEANQTQILAMAAMKQGVIGGYGYAVGVVGFVALVLSLFSWFTK